MTVFSPYDVRDYAIRTFLKEGLYNSDLTRYDIIELASVYVPMMNTLFNPWFNRTEEQGLDDVNKIMSIMGKPTVSSRDDYDTLIETLIDDAIKTLGLIELRDTINGRETVKYLLQQSKEESQ